MYILYTYCKYEFSSSASVCEKLDPESYTVLLHTVPWRSYYIFCFTKTRARHSRLFIIVRRHYLRYFSVNFGLLRARKHNALGDSQLPESFSFCSTTFSKSATRRSYRSAERLIVILSFFGQREKYIDFVHHGSVYIYISFQDGRTTLNTVQFDQTRLPKMPIYNNYEIGRKRLTRSRSVLLIFIYNDNVARVRTTITIDMSNDFRF